MSSVPQHRTAGRVLVTGAAGVMGVRLVSGLVQRGFPVRCLVLPKDPGAARLRQLGAELREGDISELTTLSGLCDDVETVYHLAAVILSREPALFTRVNLLGTQNLVRVASAAKVRHFIYVSSASVTYPRRTPYAESKWQAEQCVRAETAFQHTIVRPTLVYDDHGGQEFLLFERYLLRFPLVPFIGGGDARKRPVHAQDVIDGLLAIADNRAAYGKLYNLSGPESITMRELAELMLRERDAQRPFIHLPVALCTWLARVMEACLARPPLTRSAIAGIVNDADLDPGDAMRELGYAPIGVREGLARRAAALRGASRSAPQSSFVLRKSS